MASTYDDGTVLAVISPETTGYSAPLVADLLEQAKVTIGEGAFGEDTTRAHALMAAHLLATHPGAGGAGGSMFAGGGRVKSMADAGTSVTFADAKLGTLAESLSGSWYGEQLLAMIRARGLDFRAALVRTGWRGPVRY